MYPYMLASHVHPGAYLSSHHHHYTDPQSLSPRHRYYNALMEARAAELEMRAEAVARLEGELIQCPLQELPQSRLVLQPHFDSSPLYCVHTLAHQSWDDRLETLRLQLQEQDQLARLEVVRKKRIDLEERLRAATKLRHGNLQGNLAQREKARRLCDLEIAEEEARLSRSSPPVTTKTPATIGPHPRSATGFSRPTHPFPSYLDVLYPPSRKTSQQFELVVHLTPEKTRSTEPLPQLAKQAPRTSPQPRKEQQIGPWATPTHLARSTDPQQLRRTPAVQIQVSSGVPKTSPKDLAPAPNSINQYVNQTQGLQQEKSYSQSPQPSVFETTLKEQLEKRLNSEYASEVRDTIEALMNSLNDIQPPVKPTETPSTSPPSTLKLSAKGKTKEASSITEKKLSIRDIDDALLQVRELEQRFYALENDFMFPANPDFTAPTSSGAVSVTSHLAYNANNHPIRFYEQSLSQLLVQLDLIESHGNEELRNKRKDVVRKVERALEELEQELERRLDAKLTRESKRRSVTVEDITSPEEHLGITEPIPAPPVAGKTEARSSPDPSPILSEPTEEVALSPLCQGEPSIEGPLKGRPMEGPSTEPPAQEHSVALAVTPLSYQEVSTPEIRGSALDANGSLTEDLSSDTTELLPAYSPFHSELEPSLAKAKGALVATLSELREGSNEDPTTIFTLGSEPTKSEPRPSPLPRETPIIESQSDLAAIIRSPADSLSDLETKSEVGEAKGSLLNHGSIESSDISDAESMSSDWSELVTTTP